jgi:hypothetical protein
MMRKPVDKLLPLASDPEVMEEDAPPGCRALLTGASGHGGVEKGDVASGL